MSFLDTADHLRFSPEKLARNNLFETPDLFCDVYCLEPGQAQKPHAHAGATKLYYVIEGRARFTLGGEQRELGPGGLAWAAPGEPHGVKNTSSARAVLLVAMGPNPNFA